MNLVIGLYLIVANTVGFAETIMRLHFCTPQMYQSEDGALTEEDLTCILKTAMGVSDLNISNLFRAIDENERGKITYGKSHEMVLTIHKQREIFGLGTRRVSC